MVSAGAHEALSSAAEVKYGTRSVLRDEQELGNCMQIRLRAYQLLPLPEWPTKHRDWDHSLRPYLSSKLLTCAYILVARGSVGGSAPDGVRKRPARAICH